MTDSLKLGMRGVCEVLNTNLGLKLKMADPIFSKKISKKFNILADFNKTGYQGLFRALSTNLGINSKIENSRFIMATQNCPQFNIQYLNSF